MIFDTERKSFVILEATRLVDPSMPLETFKKITYSVPVNDSVHFVCLFCNLIMKTIQYEQKKLATAKGTWLRKLSRKLASPIEENAANLFFRRYSLFFRRYSAEV
ncbi:putative ribosomal protein S2, bacteria/mitochondria/plastid [Helianthus anomalus]